MPDDDSVFPEPDDAFLERYRRICEQAGVEPVSEAKARELVRHWNALAADPSAASRLQ